MESNLEGAAGNIEIVRRIMNAVRERNLTVLVDAYASDIDDPRCGIASVRWDISRAPGHDREWHGVCAHLGPAPNISRSGPRSGIFGSGDQVVALWRLKASGKDGQRLDRPAISLFQLRDRKVVRLQMFHYDTAAIGRFLQCQTE